MFETIAVLVVFFFLIGFGITFYFMIEKVGAKKEAKRAQALQVIQYIEKIGSLPELDCIRVGVEVENCMDLLKLEALAIQLEDPLKMDEYYDTFGNTDIEVQVLFPSEFNITLYSNPLDEGWESSIHPIMVYNPVNKTFNFAIIEVKLYER